MLRTDRQMHRQTQLNALLPQLSSLVGVSDYNDNNNLLLGLLTIKDFFDD